MLFDQYDRSEQLNSVNSQTRVLALKNGESYEKNTRRKFYRFLVTSFKAFGSDSDPILFYVKNRVFKVISALQGLIFI